MGFYWDILCVTSFQKAILNGIFCCGIWWGYIMIYRQQYDVCAMVKLRGIPSVKLVQKWSSTPEGDAHWTIVTIPHWRAGKSPRNEMIIAHMEIHDQVRVRLKNGKRNETNNGSYGSDGHPSIIPASWIRFRDEKLVFSPLKTIALVGFLYVILEAIQVSSPVSMWPKRNH